MDRRARLALWFVAIFLLGVATRIYLEKYTYIFGFDSYWFARMVSYIIQDGRLPKYDPLAFRGYDPVKLKWELSMEFPAWVYKLVYGNQYDPMKLFKVFQWLPAVFGALGSVFVGALVLVLTANPVSAVLSGIFAATNPAYIYRTMGSFYEDDATSFFIPLGFLFAFMAYSAKDRRKFWMYTFLAGLALLLQAISWLGYLNVPYTVAVFVMLFVGYHVVSWLSRKVPESFKRAKTYTLPVTAAVFALVAWLIVRGIALDELSIALALTGKYSPTTIYTLFINPFVVALFGIFAASMAYALRSNDKRQFTIAIIAVALAFLLLSWQAGSTHSIRLTTADGMDRRVSFEFSDTPAYVLFGSLLVILVAQIAGLFAFLLFTGDRWRSDVDKRILVVVFVPLLFSAFAGFFGIDWYHPFLSYISGFFKEPAEAHGATSAVTPGAGLIEPYSKSPWAGVIGEERIGFDNWPAKYGLLAILVLFSLPFIFYRATDDRRYLFILAWVVLTWYTSWYKLKWAYYFGMPIAIAVGIMFGEIWLRAKSASRGTKVIYASAVTLVVLSMLSTGIYHTVTRVPFLLTPEEANEMRIFGGTSGEDYIAMFNFIDNNLPRDANLLNWWDIGHWLTFFTGRGVMTDNTNTRMQADYDAAKFFLSDENTAYAIAKSKGMNYVIFDSTLLFRSRVLAMYALQTKNFYDPRLLNYDMIQVGCTLTSMPLSGEYAFICTSPFSPQANRLTFKIDLNTMAKIPPLAPGNYVPSNQAIKVRIYNPYDNKYYEYVPYLASALQDNTIRLLLVAPALNDSVAMKMLLDAPMEHFKEVWESPSGRMKIYEIE